MFGRMSRRRVVGLALGTAATAVLAACGAPTPTAAPPKPTEAPKPVAAATKPAETAKPTEAPKPAEAVKPAEAPKPAEAAKPTEAAKPVAPVAAPAATKPSAELVLWIADFDEPLKKTVDGDLIPGLKTAFGHSVKPDYVGYDNLTQKILTAFAGGVLADSLVVGAAWPTPLIARGVTRDLTDYIKKWGQKDDFYSASWETSWKGKDYGVPIWTAPRTMLYRKDFMQEAGLSPDKPPIQWDELSAAAVKMTKREGDVVKVSGFNTTTSWQHFIIFLWQAGGDFFTADGARTTFNSPEGEAALQFMSDFFDKHKVVDKKGMASPQPNVGAFVANAVASEVNNMSILAAMKQFNAAKLDQVLVAPPTMKTKQVSSAWTGSFVVNGKAKNPDAAWEIVQHFTAPENMLKYNQSWQFVSPRNSLKGKGYQSDPNTAKFADILDKFGKALPQSPIWLDMRIGLGNMCDDALFGKKSIKQSLADYAKEADAKLAEFK